MEHTSYAVKNTEGDTVRVTYAVHDIDGDLVRLSETLCGRWWTEDQTSDGVLRFLAADALAAFLEDAGFSIEEQFGDWDRGPVTNASDEIITIARRG